MSFNLHDTVTKCHEETVRRLLARPDALHLHEFQFVMAGKTLSLQPLIHPTATLHDSHAGAYCEIGARTVLHEVTMGDYSYVVNDSQIAYATIGKFCSIAAMTRINPGNHPMHRAAQAHFSYRASAYFPRRSRRRRVF